MWLRNIYYKIKHFYNSLSNRTLWFLLLLVIIFSGYLFYLYIFVFSLYNVWISSNIWEYKVSLFAKDISKTINFNCKQTKCSLNKIPALNYEMLITKIWYNNIEINFNPKNKQKFDIYLEKKVILKKLDKIAIKNLSRNEKIDLIKKKNNNYFFQKIWDNEFSFKNLWNRLELYFDSKKVSILNKINKEDIFINKVYGTQKYFYIKYWNTNYLLNKDFLSINKIDFDIDIKYLKLIQDVNILITTKDWSFIYNLIDKNIVYFNSLYDFVILKNWDYIWILSDNNKLQKVNLWFWKISGDLLVYYDQKTKDARLLKKIDFQVNKIYMNNNKIFLEDNLWNIYNLENY